MSTVTITIPDDRWQKLQDLAAELQVTPEDLLRASLEDMLSRPDEQFQRSLSYVLKKNAELYRRLA